MSVSKDVKKGGDPFKALQSAFEVLTGTAREVFLGIRYKTAPWDFVLFCGCLGFLAYATGWDLNVFKWLYISKFYPAKISPVLIYLFWLGTWGLWVWGLAQWAKRKNFSRTLERIFSEGGLKSNQGRIPKLIYDKSYEDQTRVLRVTVNGASLDKFKSAQGTIESNLGVFVDHIKENRLEKTIDIVYSSKRMPSCLRVGKLSELPPFKFFVGETRTGKVLADIREVPHLLIAGQTGGGKSTFLRQFIATHFLNLKNRKFTFIDLKEGLEAHLFEGLPDITICNNIEQAIHRLTVFERKLTNRLTDIKAAHCVDLEQYEKKPGMRALSRHFIIVDEAAELFLAGGATKSSQVQIARRVLSDIARRGRAAGVHLVIATQRPDSRSLDPQVKANLPGVLCFPMANDAEDVQRIGRI